MQEYAVQHEAETMQAVSNMLELVPTGVNKGSGMRKLLADMKLPVEVHASLCHLEDQQPFVLVATGQAQLSGLHFSIPVMAMFRFGSSHHRVAMQHHTDP